jgi:uncharacterized protein YciI
MRKKMLPVLVAASLALATPSFLSLAGSGKKDAPAAKSQFLIRLTSRHPEAAASAEEKTRIVMHFDYLKTLLADGKLVFAGISTDDYASVLLVEAADREEAERMLASDPAVSGDVYQGEIHPFQTVLARQDH